MTKTTDASTYIIYIVAMSLISVMAFAISFIIGSDYTKLRESCTSPVSAVVVDHSRLANRFNENPTYAPVFQYVFEGETYEASPQSGSSYARKEFPVGSEHTLLVNPSNPEEFLYEPQSGGTSSTTILILGLRLLGMVLAVVSVSLIWFKILLPITKKTDIK